MIIATVMLILSTICNMSQPYYFGKIIEICADDGSRKSLDRYTVILVVINVVGAVTSCIRGWLFNLIGERIVRSLRNTLFEKISSQDISFFDKNKTGELINRLASDTAVLQASLSSNVSVGLRNAATIVSAIILLFVTSWKLTLVVTCCQ
jgi:ABC-type multidrug transport system fused ATPase/permease subunit